MRSLNDNHTGVDEFPDLSRVASMLRPSTSEGVSLKPCPFCGCEVELVASKNAPDRLLVIACKSPSPCIGSGLGGFYILESQRAEGIAAWNRRTPPARSIDAGDGREQDTARLDWLEKMVVNVRTQLVYGSRNVFWATPDEPFPSDIRKQIDRAMLAAASPVPQAPSDGVKATHRHVKRGTEYVLIGYGKMQAEAWADDANEGETVDMREVAIYRAVDDGSLWVRPREEFEDGRFIALPSQDTRTGGQS